MKINTPYSIEDKVYLVNDPDQRLRLITGICIRQDGVSYELSNAGSTSWHFDFEFSDEKNYTI